MSSPLSPPHVLEERDKGHLKALAITHYVLGGFDLVMSPVSLVIQIVFIHVFQSMLRDGKFPFPHNAFPPSPGLSAGGAPFPPGPEFGMILGWLIPFMVVICVISVVIALLTIYGGRLLLQRKGYTFLYVLSFIHLLAFPLGTTLGVFTLIVLGRYSVSREFEKY